LRHQIGIDGRRSPALKRQRQFVGKRFPDVRGWQSKRQQIAVFKELDAKASANEPIRSVGPMFAVAIHGVALYASKVCAHSRHRQAAAVTNDGISAKFHGQKSAMPELT
jgi:hypothetical protein